jgi:hypothetical protein
MAFGVRQALRKRLQEIEKELVTVSKLAEFVKPALPELLPPVPVSAPQEAKDKSEPVHIPLQQPARPHPAHMAEPFVPEEESEDEEEQKALAEAKQALEDEEEGDEQQKEEPSSESADDSSNKRQKEDTLRHEGEAQQQPRAQPQPKRKVYGPTMPQRNQRPKMATPAAGFDEDVLQDGEVAWVPPKGQTGDGRTALNDKLGY